MRAASLSPPPVKCTICHCKSKSLLRAAKCGTNSFRLVAPCEAPVTSKVDRLGSKPSFARQLAASPGAIAQRRTGNPSAIPFQRAKPVAATALKTCVARDCTKRLARPGVASKFSSVIGIPSFRAATTTGAVTNPPRLTMWRMSRSRMTCVARRLAAKKLRANFNACFNDGGDAGIGSAIAPAWRNMSASMARVLHKNTLFILGARVASRCAMAIPGLMCPPEPPPANPTAPSCATSCASSCVMNNPRVTWHITWCFYFCVHRAIQIHQCIFHTLT